MITLFALQVGIPLFLVACALFAPARSRFGFWVQILATAAALLAIALTGLWIIPPWWAPYAFGVLMLAAVVYALRRPPGFSTGRPISLGSWAIVAVYLGLGGIALFQAVTALAARTPPQASLVELAFPLDAGTYFVVNGGSHMSINAHMKTLDATVPRFQNWRGQSYGVDIVEIDALGLRAPGLQPTNPSAYRIYGAQVLAPCAGEIVTAVDGLPDMQVPLADNDRKAGNHVIVRCRGADVVLAHLRPGSLKVAQGTRVDIGTPIGEVGNSGNTDEPHLHIHAQEPGPAGQPMAGNPLPMLLGGRYLVRNDRVTVP